MAATANKKARGKTPKPGEYVEVEGSRGGVYKVTHHRDGAWSCTCPAWRINRLPVAERHCKHLQAILSGSSSAPRSPGRLVASTRARTSRSSAPRARTSRSSTPARRSRVSAPRHKPVKVMLAQTWAPDMDPTGWWLSPKLDGVRAIWDGKALYSRNGNRFHAPPSFTACLPKEPLDGELYLGPGAFSETVSIVKSATDKGWGRLTFEVFDAPAASGGFEARQRRLKAMVSAARGAGCRLRLVPQILCTGAAHLRRFHADQVAKGVEGTMLRAPRSPYEARRSGLLRKLKDFLDMEVEIVDTYAGTGKLKGLIGGYVVKAKDGTIFKVGSGLTDAQRARPLRPGTRITIAYQERSKRGSPRFPTYVGERADR